MKIDSSAGGRSRNDAQDLEQSSAVNRVWPRMIPRASSIRAREGRACCSPTTSAMYSAHDEHHQPAVHHQHDHAQPQHGRLHYPATSFATRAPLPIPSPRPPTHPPPEPRTHRPARTPGWQSLVALQATASHLGLDAAELLRAGGATVTRAVVVSLLNDLA